MYHNIIPDEYFDDSINLEYSISESRFRKHINFIEKKFRTGTDLLNSDQITITFDDGYLNQYSIGSQILDEKNIKGYFFCAEDLISNDRTLLIDKIQFWFDFVPYGTYKVDKLNLTFQINSEEDRKSSWSKVHKLIVDNDVSMKEIDICLDKVYAFDSIKIEQEFFDLRFKSIKENDIRKMKDKGHKIGVHSSKHLILSNMKVDELEKDIKCCIDKLGKIYNTDVYCYPFGAFEDVSDTAIDVVKKHNFKYALASLNQPEGYKRYSLHYMPRIDISRIDSEDHLDFILSGAKYLIQHRKLLPMV